MLCYVALPHVALGWFAVCDCGIVDHTHLLNIDNPYLEQMISQVYTTEIKLNKAKQ